MPETLWMSACKVLASYVNSRAGEGPLFQLRGPPLRTEIARRCSSCARALTGTLARAPPQEGECARSVRRCGIPQT